MNLELLNLRPTGYLWTTVHRKKTIFFWYIFIYIYIYIKIFSRVINRLLLCRFVWYSLWLFPNLRVWYVFLSNPEVILYSCWEFAEQKCTDIFIGFRIWCVLCCLFNVFEEIRERFMLGVIFELIPSVSRYFFEVISSVLFTEHLEDPSECGVWGHSDGLPEFNGAFAEEAYEELEFLLFGGLILKKTYMVQEQVVELVVTLFLSFWRWALGFGAVCAFGCSSGSSWGHLWSRSSTESCRAQYHFLQTVLGHS